jgi:hypothetical protein
MRGSHRDARSREVHDPDGAMRKTLTLATLLALTAPAAAEPTIREYRSDDTLLNLGHYRFDNGRVLNLTVGIGSGAFRHPDDPPNVFWSVGDRGPNFTCSEAKAIARTELAACREAGNARIYLMPSYASSSSTTR